MEWILPVATIVLVGLGSLCLFLMIENDRRYRAMVKQGGRPQTQVQVHVHTTASIQAEALHGLRLGVSRTK